MIGYNFELNLQKNHINICFFERCAYICNRYEQHVLLLQRFLYFSNGAGRFVIILDETNTKKS